MFCHRGFTEVADPISPGRPHRGVALWDVSVSPVAEPCHQASAQQLRASVKMAKRPESRVEWTVLPMDFFGILEDVQMGKTYE